MRSCPFLSARIVLAALASIAAQQACAQNVQKIAYTLPQGSAKFLQEQVIEVGDVPGHKLRVFESKVDYQNVNAAFGGVRVKESYTRGASDYVNGNGTASSYAVYVLEDGNRLFTKESAVGQLSQAADGAPVFRYTVVATFTGGTGRFQNIRGTLRGNVVRAPGENGVKADVTGEYWLDE
ncbi:MAG: hypothetical protein K2Y35_14290 [Burkholderiales bacterium]|nr:hypothetical protein [Burkholderiales bacterium]